MLLYSFCRSSKLPSLVTRILLVHTLACPYEVRMFCLAPKKTHDTLCVPRQILSYLISLQTCSYLVPCCMFLFLFSWNRWVVGISSRSKCKFTRVYANTFTIQEKNENICSSEKIYYTCKNTKIIAYIKAIEFRKVKKQGKINSLFWIAFI